MKRSVKIRLQPSGETVEAETGTPLKDVLFDQGVEFPCGGKGRCRGCRVRVIQGQLPVTPEEEKALAREELESGWRLACCHTVHEHLALEVAQWGVSILSDETAFDFTPKDGFGIAVDLGTTTIVAQAVDLRTGQVLGVRSALNPQARHGSNIMSRIHYAVEEKGQARLETMVHEEVNGLIQPLSASASERNGPFREVVLVGNTVMHHLFCGIPLEPLAGYPFETERGGLVTLSPHHLDWELEESPVVRFLPCLGSFVGSDLLAGIVAVGMHESEALTVLIDLGTNGEIVAGNRDRILCASAAAGPAFEGGAISMGMRASTGAVSAVTLEQGAMACRVIGRGKPRGICGSGLVDAVAAGLDLGWIDPGGRLTDGKKSLPLSHGVSITQGDIRELQLAKGAIAAGIRILLNRLNHSPDEVGRVYIAGAFGNYVSRDSAQHIGLIRFPPEITHGAGNTALRGAKMALFGNGEGEEAGYGSILGLTEHVSLSSDALFQEIFIDEMGFPEQPCPAA